MHRSRVCVASVLLALAISSGPTASAATSWGPIARISGLNPAFSTFGAIAKAGLTVGVAWIERGHDGVWRLYFRRSLDGGVTWGSRRLISGTGQALTVTLAGVGSGFDMVWTFSPDGGETSQLWYAHSANEGASWGLKQQLTPTTEAAYAPDVARDAAGHVAVVWTGGNTMLPPRVWVRISRDGGKTFRPRKELNVIEYGSPGAGVAVGPYGNIHVVYNNGVVPSGGGNIWYQRSTDGGEHWAAARRLASSDEGDPTIAASRHTLIVGYQKLAVTSQGPQRWIEYRRSTDNGRDWESARQLTTFAGQDSVAPVFSVRSGQWRALFVRCLGVPCSPATVYVRVSANAGVTWSGPSAVSPDATVGNYPIGVDGGKRIVVAWGVQGQDLPIKVLARRSN